VGPEGCGTDASQSSRPLCNVPIAHRDVRRRVLRPVSGLTIAPEVPADGLPTSDFGRGGLGSATFRLPLRGQCRNGL